MGNRLPVFWNVFYFSHSLPDLLRFLPVFQIFVQIFVSATNPPFHERFFMLRVIFSLSPRLKRAARPTSELPTSELPTSKIPAFRIPISRFSLVLLCALIFVSFNPSSPQNSRLFASESESDAALNATSTSAPDSASTSVSPRKTVVHLEDNGAALRNPGMGWVFHHYDNSIWQYGEICGPGYDGREFPGLSVVYLRIAWSFLEPAEGEFNWSILDSVIQRYERMGIRYAFRITAFEGNAAEDGIPRWLREAGCPGFIGTAYGKEHWEVDYASEMLLEKLENFLTALGKRYGDDPNLEFVDVGSLGIWGEGHPIAKPYPTEVLKKHCELHKKAFPKKWIVFNDDMCRHFHPDAKPNGKFQEETIRMLLDGGYAFRDDSLNVFADPNFMYSADLAERFWRNVPTILEMGHYEYAKKVNAWGGERYSKALSDYHGSYASIHGNPMQFLKENQDLIHEMNLKMGYRFLLQTAEWQTEIAQNEKFSVDFVWKNVGVAPTYRDVFPIWTLLNEKGDVCAVFADDSLNLRSVLPDKTRDGSCAYRLPPTLQPGKYLLCVSAGTAYGRPELELPHASCAEKKMFEREFPFGRRDDSDFRRYPLGELRVVPKR